MVKTNVFPVLFFFLVGAWTIVTTSQITDSSSRPQNASQNKFSSLLFTFLFSLLLLYLPKVFSFSRKIKVPVTTTFFGIPALSSHSKFTRILSLWSKRSVFRFHPGPIFFILQQQPSNFFLCHVKWVVINSSHCDCWF